MTWSHQQAANRGGALRAIAFNMLQLWPVAYVLALMANASESGP